MDLAAALLEKGRKDNVLTYLELCGQFWAMGGPALEKWRQQIQRGQKPTFSLADVIAPRQ